MHAAIFNKHILLPRKRYILTPTKSFVSIYVADELKRRNIKLLESNQQQAAEYFAVVEQIERCEYRLHTNGPDVTRCINIFARIHPTRE